VTTRVHSVSYPAEDPTGSPVGLERLRIVATSSFAPGKRNAAAAAAPTGGSNAADTVKSLQGQGYSVQVNGSVTAPLSQRIVTGVHGGAARFTTAYVDVCCPPSNN
jgi:hypothetical protein